MGQTNTPTNSARYVHRSVDFAKVFDNSQSTTGEHEGI